MGGRRAFEAAGRRFPKAQVDQVLEARIGALESVAELPASMVRPIRRLMCRIRAVADRLRAPAARGAQEEGTSESPRAGST